MSPPWMAKSGVRSLFLLLFSLTESVLASCVVGLSRKLPSKRLSNILQIFSLFF